MASRKSSLDIEMIETNPNHSPTLTDDELLVEKRSFVPGRLVLPPN